MNADSQIWLDYARDNLAVTEWCLESGRLNPCLQNAQQTVEKAIKALVAHHKMPEKRTHSIHTLNADLRRINIDVGLQAEDCELLDSIYLESKYPLPSVIAHGPPDLETCKKCAGLARSVLEATDRLIGK